MRASARRAGDEAPHPGFSFFVDSNFMGNLEISAPDTMGVLAVVDIPVSFYRGEK
jgi:hypothetical protein